MGSRPIPVLDHIDVVANGTENDPVTLSFQVSNNGGTGNAYMHWYLYDSSDVELDGGSEEFEITHGTDTYVFTGLVYPAAGTGYYFTVETSGGTPQNSNDFDVTT